MSDVRAFTTHKTIKDPRMTDGTDSLTCFSRHEWSRYVKMGIYPPTNRNMRSLTWSIDFSWCYFWGTGPSQSQAQRWRLSRSIWANQNRWIETLQWRDLRGASIQHWNSLWRNSLCCTDTSKHKHRWKKEITMTIQNFHAVMRQQQWEDCYLITRSQIM